MSVDLLSPEQRALIHAVSPSAMPSEEEIAAWRGLPRDEQLKRMRSALASVEASTPCETRMADIWAEIDAETQPDR
jgi:hypothetical protein